MEASEAPTPMRMSSTPGGIKLMTSYFYGLPWSKHIVIYDTLIEQSTPSEVEAVLGHELGHWYFCKSLSAFHYKLTV